MDSPQKILLIDFCNFEDYPMGGHLSFAKNLMLGFKDQLILVGITTSDKEPVGRWFKKEINGVTYDFFAMARYNKARTKHILPDRLMTYFYLKFYKKKILQVNIRNVFIQKQDILLAVKNFGFKNICYCFAGLENPLQFSKYWYAHYASRIFDKRFFSSFGNVKVILASGDDNAIKKMALRSNGKISSSTVIKFPTRINTDVFKPLNRCESRKILGISESATVISTTGRLAWLKGWKFMIDCFAEFEKRIPDSLFYFIGEGEDQHKIEEYISLKGLSHKIKLAGGKDQQHIALFLNASDLYIMGSYKEGWSTTLLEALACGVPICTTNFSSARDIVTNNITGYVIDDREVAIFSDKMDKALRLERAKLPISSEVKRYAVSELKTDILKFWELT